MKTEYRIIFTATFDTAAERDKMYGALKDGIVGDIGRSGIAKRADMTKDEYHVPDSPTTSEKVI
jgi:hypothetical protein